MKARRAGALAVAGVVVLAGCGGGKRQDANEPKGTYKVQVTRATFPQGQKLAKRSELVIGVRNAGDKTIPNIAVTVHGFSRREDNPQLADPNRPVFVINGVPREIGGFPESKEAAPTGCETAYVDTWGCGKLKAGQERTFKWIVTAVKAVKYRVRYEVSAGLDGEAKAVDATGNRPTGLFVGTISNAAPDVRVSDDGKTIVRGTR